MTNDKIAPDTKRIHDDVLYLPTEAASLLRVNYRTALAEIHAGRLHAVAVGPKPIYRVPGWALRDYMAGRAPRHSVAAFL